MFIQLINIICLRIQSLAKHVEIYSALFDLSHISSVIDKIIQMDIGSTPNRIMVYSLKIQLGIQHLTNVLLN